MEQHFIVYYQKIQMGEQQIQLQVRCREGPLPQRRCTDWFCCFLYILLISTIFFFILFAGNATAMSKSQIEIQLLKQSGVHPLLAISQSMINIIVSLALAMAICIIVVVITFIIPAVSAYIIMPLMLLFMLLIGSAFLYRFFGKKLPFVSQNIQNQYAEDASLVSLLVGGGFILGFLVALIVICAKQQRFRFIVSSLQLSKKCFWDNSYCFVVSFILSGFSLLVVYVNITFLQIASLRKGSQTIVSQTFLVILILVQVAWTHGYLQAFSDYFYESVAIYWYFNKKAKQQSGGYSGCSHVLTPTIKNSFIHNGSIMYGWILSFIPQSLITLLNSCQQKTACCQKIGCSSLSKYAYIGTIMYSYPFCAASRSVKQIRANAKHTFPQLYMVGNFYITIAKIFVVMTTIIVCYFLNSNTFKTESVINNIAPLIATLLPTMQIANHFMNSTGLVGDTIYLAYVIDFNCETSNFGNLKAEHCPHEAYEIINEAKINRYSDYG